MHTHLNYIAFYGYALRINIYEQRSLSCANFANFDIHIVFIYLFIAQLRFSYDFLDSSNDSSALNL